MSKCEEKGILHKQILGGIFVKPRYFIALKHNWSAQLWKWPPWASLEADWNSTTEKLDWSLTRRGHSKGVSVVLSGVSPPNLTCTVPLLRNRLGGQELFQYIPSSFQLIPMLLWGIAERKWNICRLLFSFSSTLSFFSPLRDGVNISKFYKAHHFELIFISQ